MSWKLYDAQGRQIIVAGQSTTTRRQTMTAQQLFNFSNVVLARWPDASTVGLTYTCRVPADWVAGTDITVNMFIYQTDTGGSPTAVMTSSIGVNKEGDTISTTNIENAASVNKALAQNTVVLQQRTISGASIEADDTIRWELVRIGGDAGDTVNAVVRSRLGVWIEYTATVGPVTSVIPVHQHTAAPEGGVLTDDEHDGFSEYAEIAEPSTPAANKLRLYAKDFSGDSAPFVKDDAGNEHWLMDKRWANYPIYGPAASSQWLAETLTGTSVFSAIINRLDIRPVNGVAVVIAANNAPGLVPGVASTIIDWDKRVLFKVLFTVFTADSTSTNLLQLGRDLTPGFTELTDKGISVRIDNLTMKGQVHDGVGLTDIGTLATLTAAETNELLIISRGDGTVEWFLNGASLGTSTGGPTGLSTNNFTIPMFASRDNAGSLGRMFIHQVDVMVI